MIKKIWKRLRRHHRIQRLARRFRPYMPARPRWRDVLNGFSFSPVDVNAKKVLVATGTGSHWAMSGFESVLAASLKIRGAQVSALLCDGVLPACQECDLRLLPTKELLKKGPAPLCTTCFKPAKAMFSELHMPVLAYGDWITEQDRTEIDALLKQTPDNALSAVHWRGVDAGEHAHAGALRYFGRGDLSAEPQGLAVARQYLHAALLATAALQNLLKAKSFDVVVFHHGIYVPQGIVGDVCRQFGVRVVNWHPAYRSSTYLFSHGDTYHKTMIDEPCSQWENMEWTADKEHEVMQYLESRRTGSQDWISFQRPNDFTRADLIKLGLDPERPTIGLLTNVMWDAQLHFRHNAFASMLDWILYTVDYFAKRRNLQLLIRVHPAEILGGVPSRQRVEDEIRARYPELPFNIGIVSAESPLDTYALMQGCDSVLVYGTKMAFELPCFGKPVIVAGEAWARGKGFTMDVSSVNEYREILDVLPLNKPLEDEQIRRARQYAYHLFYRRMIPVRFAKRFPRLVPFAYEVPSMSVLAPGADSGLDVICDGILTGNSFVMLSS